MTRDDDLQKSVRDKAALDRLAWHETDPDHHVTLKVEQSWLTSSGQAAWHFQKQTTEAGARRLPGVLGPDNQITIKPKISGRNLGADITRALHRSWLFDPKTVGVSATEGIVRLTGTVLRPMNDRSQPSLRGRPPA